jgi:Thrombospondin type 3 repeat
LNNNTLLLLCVIVAGIGTPAAADSMSSAHYGIRWDVAGSGGGLALSVSYTVQDSIGPSVAAGESLSVSYSLSSDFQAAPDTDTDSVRDFMDNCTLDPNTDQRDSDSDHYGNVCDAALDNDGQINFSDLGVMKQRFFSNDPDADLDGDGNVNFVDLPS